MMKLYCSLLPPRPAAIPIVRAQCVVSKPPSPQLLPALSRNTFSQKSMATITKTTTMQQSNKLNLPRTPVFKALARHPSEKTAIIHSASGKRFTYGSLLSDVSATRLRILTLIDKDGVGDLKEQRVAMLVENGYEYVVTLLSIFAAGGIAVPLCTSHPAKEQRYVLGDATPSTLIATAAFKDRALEILDNDTRRLLPLDEFPPCEAPMKVEVEFADTDWMRSKKGALIIYTSGTTNLPKGVVSTHANLAAQAGSLVDAWAMNEKDHLLHVLPLHHVHGIVNATLAPLMAGGTVEYLFPFHAPTVWARLIAGVTGKKEPVTLFMAVPTIYNRLVLTASSHPPDGQEIAKKAVQNLRIAICGSAALPGSIRDAWRELAGSKEGGGTILERYGMTELGMALSNRLPLDERVDNAVGWPLPGVEARLFDSESGKEVTTPGKEGEIQIRGPVVFREYWNKPEATAKEFEDEWFCTGDVAAKDERGCYFIQGRRSVDIIKSGGEKVSALEVERELLELPEVAEVAVVGIKDPDWGQKVAAVVVLVPGVVEKGWTLEEMRGTMKKRVANYKVPAVLKIVDALPRNQMGKINKKDLIRAVFGEDLV